LRKFKTHLNENTIFPDCILIFGIVIALAEKDEAVLYINLIRNNFSFHRLRCVMRKKVLIVEDYEDTRNFMKFLIESYGYQVIEASDGIEAVDRAKYSSPDLILMDISLPMVDGLTATRAIRETNSVAKLPIIAITAFGKAYYDKAIAAGCNDLIDKPVDFDMLKPVLNHYLAA
jgi:two-component system, cell cycle response regulator DivK